MLILTNIVNFTILPLFTYTCNHAQIHNFYVNTHLFGILFTFIYYYFFISYFKHTTCF